MNEELLSLLGATPEQIAQAQRRSGYEELGLLGQALSAAGAPAPRGTSTLGRLGQAAGMYTQAPRQTMDTLLQDLLRKQQIQDMQKKREQQARSEAARQQFAQQFAPTTPQTALAAGRVGPTAARAGMIGQTPALDRNQLLSAILDPNMPADVAERAKTVFEATKPVETKAAPGDVGVYESAIQRGVIPPDTTFEQFLTMRKPPGATVNVIPAETERQKGYGKFGVERNQAIFNAGQQAVQNIPKIDNTLNLLKEGDPRTGFGSEFLKNIDRVRAAFSGRNIQSISDTELLNSLLGADVFPQIGALGIGARGLDTPAEREFLREVMTGTIAMDKNTLIRLTELRKKYEKKSLDTYNKAVDSGQLDELFQFSGLPKRKLSVGRNIEVDF